METRAELTCAELVDLITEYLDEALPIDERTRFERHLARCAGCEDYMEEFHKTLRVAGQLSEAALAPPMRERLLAAFRDWARPVGD